MTKPTIDEILSTDNIRELVVATKTGFVSQAKTREQRELDLEEIGRLHATGVKPEDLLEVQKPAGRHVLAWFEIQ